MSFVIKLKMKMCTQELLWQLQPMGKEQLVQVACYSAYLHKFFIGLESPPDFTCKNIITNPINDPSFFHGYEKYENWRNDLIHTMSNIDFKNIPHFFQWYGLDLPRWSIQFWMTCIAYNVKQDRNLEEIISLVEYDIEDYLIGIKDIKEFTLNNVESMHGDYLEHTKFSEDILSFDDSEWASYCKSIINL